MERAEESANYGSGGDDCLESWKEIAAYLRRDVRTAQRWERSEGLPVYRHLHGERGSVYAYKSEIDGWQKAREADVRQPEVRRHTTHLLLAVAIVVAVSVLLLRHSPSRRAGSNGALRLHSDAPRILAALTDGRGRVAWIRTCRGEHRLALSPDDAELYDACSSGTVQIIDVAKRRVVYSFPAAAPNAIAVDPSGKHVYVSQSHGDILDFDRRAKTVKQIATSTRVSDIALTNEGRGLYIAAVYGGLWRADTTTGEVRQISSLPCPMRLATSPDGHLLYVCYQCGGPGGRAGHDAVDVIDTATNASVGVISGFPNVGNDIGVTPNGSQLWVDGADACSSPYYDHVGCPSPSPVAVLNVIRSSDGTALQSIAVPEETSGSQLAFSPESNRVISGGDKSVRIYSTATFAPIEEAAIRFTGDVAFSHDGSTAFLPVGDDRIAIAPIRWQSAPPAGLTGRWMADGTTSDAAGLSHASIEGNTTFQPGRIGRGFSFGTRGGSVEIDSRNLGIIDHAFTFLCWLKLDAAQQEFTIASRMCCDSQRGWRLFSDSDQHLAACLAAPTLRCTEGTAPVKGATRLLPGRWYHVGLVWNGRTAALYLDGHREAEAPLQLADNDTEVLHLGRDFHGVLDEIEIYDRPLAPREIAERKATAQ